MRILAALPYVPSRIRVRPLHLLRELGRRHDISVFIVGANPTPEEWRTLRTLSDDIVVVPPSVASMAWNCGRALVRGEPLQAAVNRSAIASARLRQLLAGQAHDVVYVEHLRAAFLHGALPPETPRVFDAVDCISLLWQRTREASHSRLRRYVAMAEAGPTRRYEASLMGRFDRVTVTSPEDADVLATLAPQAPLTVIPNGVDLEYFRPADHPYEPGSIVFSGKMSYHANVTAILHFVRDILPRVRAVLPDVRLHIVGSNPPEVVRRLAADPRIEVSGYLPDLRAAIGGAAVSICPVTVKVGIQNKILEAMAMGVPVVSSEKGAAGLTATAGRDLLVASGPEAFAKHVLTLLQDDALRTWIGSAGRRYVEREHRWDVAAARLDDVMEQAVRSRRERLLQPA